MRADRDGAGRGVERIRPAGRAGGSPGHVVAIVETAGGRRTPQRAHGDVHRLAGHHRRSQLLLGARRLSLAQKQSSLYREQDDDDQNEEAHDDADRDGERVFVPALRVPLARDDLAFGVALVRGVAAVLLAVAEQERVDALVGRRAEELVFLATLFVAVVFAVRDPVAPQVSVHAIPVLAPELMRLALAAIHLVRHVFAFRDAVAAPLGRKAGNAGQATELVGGTRRDVDAGRVVRG